MKILENMEIYSIFDQVFYLSLLIEIESHFLLKLFHCLSRLNYDIFPKKKEIN